MARPGRPLKPGARYPNGRIKAERITPNPRVVAMRRQILGAVAGEPCDISQAENPADVAVARGWLTPAQRGVAQEYASLIGRVLTSLPKVKTMKSMASAAPPKFVAQDEGGLPRTGVVTKADIALYRAAVDVDMGKLTPAKYAMMERAHRNASLDVMSMTHKDIAKLMDAIIEATPHELPVTRSQTSRIVEAALSAKADKSDDIATVQARKKISADLALLQHVWSQLYPAEARELMSFCVLCEWPNWMTEMIFHRPSTWQETQRLSFLKSGLDRIADILSQKPLRPPSPPEQPRRSGPVIEERINYVNQYGEPVLQVVKRRRCN